MTYWKSPTKIAEDDMGRAPQVISPIEPRCMKRAEAAAYLSLDPSSLDVWVAKGIVPGPIPGTHRWDRRAIDAALDRLSGLQQDESLDDSYEAWKAAQGKS